MAWEGFVSLGGLEIVNSERARRYAQSASCPMSWFKGEYAPGLPHALGDTAYTYSQISTSPWYDSTIDDISRRFYGIYGLSIEGLEDNTREVKVTEGLTDGGVHGRSRRATRNVKVTALIVGRGQDAVDYGMSWLNARLDPDACGRISLDCGVAEMRCFAASPPGQNSGETSTAWDLRTDLVRRYMRNTGCVSGAFKLEEMKSGEFWAYTVQFVLAGGPSVLGVTKPLTIGSSTPTVYQDVPYNLVPYPSADLTTGAAKAISTNYSANPSAENNATGWAYSQSTVSGTAPNAFTTAGQSSDIGAGGSGNSYRARLLGNNGSTAVSQAVSQLQVYQDVTLPAGSNRRISLNLWSAVLILNGSSPNTSIGFLAVYYEFFNGATSLGAATQFGVAGSGDYGGKAYSTSKLAVPATATIVRVKAIAQFTWSSSSTASANSDVRLYADTLAVTVP